MGERKRRMEAGTSGGGGAKPMRAEPKRFGGMRITWKAVGMFMGLMVMLDIIFYALFRFGFDTCWGVLCLIE